MYFFFITCCLLFVLFCWSFSLEQNPSRAFEMGLLSFWFWEKKSLFLIFKPVRSTFLSLFPSRMSSEKNLYVPNVDVISATSVLDLPDLALECILEKLPPQGLCRLACVCTSMRDRCTSGHMWEKHMNRKWAAVIGPASHRKWRCFVDSGSCSLFFSHGRPKGLLGHFLQLWALITPSTSKNKNYNSIMSWYIALESGKFWFPAQVYNRENGHAGFVLSCYDAELSYDRRTDTFTARYPPHGRRARALEDGVTWDRLRAPPVDTSPHELHASDCLNNLQPGDHIEIQWRKNKEFPYGWWYGVVGHLETCGRLASDCRCHETNTVVLEFNHYALGSPWRRAAVSRTEHREEGNEADGFYGGIRKLCNEDDIGMWKKLWPAKVSE